MKKLEGMKINRVEYKIGKYTFLIPKLPLKKQRKVLFKLAGVAGVPLAELLGDEIAEAKGKKKATKGEEAIMQGLKTVVATLGTDSTLDTYEELLEDFKGPAKVRYRREEDGEMLEPRLDDVYEQIMTLDVEAQFFWACLDENYRPFLERVRDVAQARLAARAVQTKAVSE